MEDFNNQNGNGNEQPLNNQNSEQLPQLDQQPQNDQQLYQQPQNDQQQYQQPQYNQYQYQPYEQPPKKDNGMAIGSMVCGIVSFVVSCCLWYFAIPLAIVSIVLGIIVLKKKKAGKGMAIAGIVLSGISIILAIIVAIAAVALMNNEEFLNYYKGISQGI